MPPKTALAGSFQVAADAENEVVCPLQNQDGSLCRKKCIGEKRFRSMQEHIRRAHPDHYIPKLPATEESFQLMINTPPSAKPPLPPSTTGTIPPRRNTSDLHDRDIYRPTLGPIDVSAPHEVQPPAAANAAVALTQLHNWDSDFDIYGDADVKREGFELPPFRDHFITEDTLPAFQPGRPRELLPSILTSPTNRYSSLPPIHKRDKINRPRKPSMGQNARKGKHERGKSRDFSAKEFSRRLSVGERKAMSAEPPTAAWVQGKRWEDLIEAATSATEADDDRDLTPMPQSPNFPPSSAAAAATTNARLSAADISGGVASSTPPASSAVAGSSLSSKRSSLPPGFRPLGHLQSHQHHQYNASPLQRTLTPPPPDNLGPDESEPFPSVETLESAGSGTNFHIPRSGLPSSSSIDLTSPMQPRSHGPHHSQTSSFGSRAEMLEIFCASCGRPWLLKNAFACTECICGVCSDCVGQIISSPVITVQPGFAPIRRGCPRCGVMGGKWKRFQLDFR